MNHNDIFGFFDFEDIYDKAVNEAADGDHFLEIGCLLGKSTAYLLQKIKESGKKIDVVVIDTFKGNGEQHDKNIAEHGNGDQYRSFMNNVTKCPGSEALVDVIVANSHEPSGDLIAGMDVLPSTLFPDDYFRFIFVDAAHEYEAVKRDLELWLPKLRIGGLFAGHDYADHTGVPKAVQEVIGMPHVSKATWYKTIEKR